VTTLLNQPPVRSSSPETGSVTGPEITGALTALELEVTRSLQAAFAAPVPLLSGLDLVLKSRQGNFVFLRKGVPVTPPVLMTEPETLPMDQVSRCAFVVSSTPFEVLARCQNDPALLSLAQLLVKNAAGLIESRKHEEVLMEEIAADWESLSALCEINSEIFASSTITDGTYRLITRIASLRLGFHGALFLRRDNLLECVVSTGRQSPPVPVDALGLLQPMWDQRRTIVLNKLEPEIADDSPENPVDDNPVDEKDVCWKHARCLAAVPMLSKDDTRGFVVVWSELEKHSVDTSFQHLIDALSNRVSMLLECDALTNAARHTELLEQELQIASIIQTTLLGGDVPADFAGVDFAALSIPSRTIDGDFYDFYKQGDDTIDLLIGDVMGKGVAAALLGTAVKNEFTKSVLSHAGISNGERTKPEVVVQQVARNLNVRLIEVERFVTLLYARLRMPSRILEFVDCGHTETVVHRKKCGNSFVLRGDNVPLGVAVRDIPAQHAIEFRPGDTILFYSDGVTENVNPSGELFGVARLIECVEQWSSCGPQILLDQLRRDSTRYCEKSAFADDFTAVAVRIRLDQKAPRHHLEAEFPRSLEYLSEVREWLEKAAALVGKEGLSDEGLFRLQIICTEAFDNCVIHGGSLPHTRPVRLEAQVFEDSIKITLEHDGPEFDPFHAAPPSFDGSRDNGFGLYIMVRSADDFAYRRKPEGLNVLTFSILQRNEEAFFHATNHYSC
jgi:sigma-B regulation protein RsbU (phosphoserine phosphatase)